MLRSIGRQSGEFVESVLKKKRKATISSLSSSVAKGGVKLLTETIILLRSNFFSYRAVSLRNSLPSDVVSAPSVDALKGRLDKYWADWCYTLDLEDFIRSRQRMNRQKA